MDFLSAAALPWLDDARRRLLQARAAQRMPHSVLLLAVPGLGAEEFARWAAALALCAADPAGGDAGRPCGTCASCLLLAADTHPDLHVVRLLEDKSEISVEQVRDLIESLSYTSYRGGFKVGLIETAELLNANGANAFLKTLEEPTANSLLMLIAKPGHRLPATIASRCLRLVLRAPETSAAAAWLESRGPTPPASAAERKLALALAGGAPLVARELLGQNLAGLDAGMREALKQLQDRSVDVTLLAERWAKSDPEIRIAWLENWITRRVSAGLGGRIRGQTAEPVRLPAALLKPKIRGLFHLLDAARDFRRLASTGMNRQLALESLLLAGRDALSK